MSYGLFLTADDLKNLANSFKEPLPPIWKSPLGLPSVETFDCEGSSEKCSLYIYPAETAKPSQETGETLQFTLALTSYLSLRKTPLSLKVNGFRIETPALQKQLLAPLLVLSCKHHPSLAKFVGGGNFKAFDILAQQVMRSAFLLASRGIFHKNMHADNTFIEDVKRESILKVYFSGFQKKSTVIFGSGSESLSAEKKRKVAIILTACMMKLLSESLTTGNLFKEILDPLWENSPIDSEFVQEHNPLILSALLDQTNLLEGVMSASGKRKHPISSTENDDANKFIFSGTAPWPTLQDVMTTKFPEELGAEYNDRIRKELCLRGLTTIKS